MPDLPASRSQDAKTALLSFPLRGLCAKELYLFFGPYDENLRFLEKSFSIEIRTRGDELILKGESLALTQAIEILAKLKEQIKKLNIENNKQAEQKHSNLALLKSLVKENLRKENNAPSLNSQAQTGQKHIGQPLNLHTPKKTIFARHERQNAYIKALQNFDLVFALGPAGTGKTYIAVAHAVNLLEQGLIRHIILSRPALEAGEKIGFLPGDMKEKLDPFFRPLYDALYDMLPKEKIEQYLEHNIIEIAPLAFMRGRTLSNSVIILDEAQNTTPTQMKMFLTRLGEASRMIITGDNSQIDLALGQKSGLSHACAILQHLKAIKFIHFNEQDIIRHELVQEILEAYNAEKPPSNARA